MPTHLGSMRMEPRNRIALGSGVSMNGCSSCSGTRGPSQEHQNYLRIRLKTLDNLRQSVYHVVTTWQPSYDVLGTETSKWLPAQVQCAYVH